MVARKSEVDKVQGAGLSRWGSVHSYRVHRQYTTGFDNSQGGFYEIHTVCEIYTSSGLARTSCFVQYAQYGGHLVALTL